MYTCVGEGSSKSISKDVGPYHRSPRSRIVEEVGKLGGQAGCNNHVSLRPRNCYIHHENELSPMVEKGLRASYQQLDGPVGHMVEELVRARRKRSVGGKKDGKNKKWKQKVGPNRKKMWPKKMP